MRILTILPVLACMSFAQSPQLRSNDGSNTFLGNLNANRFDPNSVANPIGPYGSVFGPNSVNNPVGIYGSRVSPYSANNPFATQAPKIITPNGNYIGTFGTNPFAPNSVSNPFGVYGNPLSPTSINNPIGSYGSPLSAQGVRNPFSTGTGTFQLPVPNFQAPNLVNSGDAPDAYTAPGGIPFMAVPAAPNAPTQRYNTNRGTEPTPNKFQYPPPARSNQNTGTGARQVYRTPRD
jgi:hypothetical protein